MNKLFIMAAAVGVALTACTNEKEDLGTLKGDKLISFSNPVVAPSTRAIAGEIGTTYSISESFGVYAVFTKEKLVTWEAGEAFITNDKASYKENVTEPKKKTFVTATDYYWPPVGYLSFYAYSPHGVANVSYTNNGLQISSFEVPANGYTEAQRGKTVSGAQYDLMYSDLTKDQTSSTFTTTLGNTVYDGVNIKFKHALSSVKFTAKLKETYTGYNLAIKEIKLTGVKNTGVFNQAAGWTSQAGSADYAVLGTSVASVALTNTAADIIDKGGCDLILLPQTFADNDNAKLTITWTFQKGEGQVVEATSTTLLKNIKFDSQANGLWEMGKRYTYNIIVGLDKIYFAPSCTDWTNATGADNEIK